MRAQNTADAESRRVPVVIRVPGSPPAAFQHAGRREATALAALLQNGGPPKQRRAFRRHLRLNLFLRIVIFIL